MLSQETCREISNTPSATRDVLTRSGKMYATKSSSGDVKHSWKAYIDVSIATTSRDVLVNIEGFFFSKEFFNYVSRAFKDSIASNTLSTSRDVLTDF